MALSSEEYLTLNSKIMQLEKRIKALENDQGQMETVANADQREVALRTEINDLATDIQKLYEKLSLIQLPSETRFYLTEREVLYLRTLAKELNTVKAEVERTLQAVLSKLQYINPASA